MLQKFITNSAEETQKLGEDLAKEILAQGPKKTAVVLALQGDLGGGKTTFLQGLAKGLGIKEKILSPTFVIMKKFQIPKKSILSKILRSENSGQDYFYHFDCYRLKNEKDILELGFEEIISDPKNIVAIEWPERIKKVLPKNILKIKFKLTCPESRRRVDENKREIIFDTTFKVI